MPDPTESRNSVEPSNCRRYSHRRSPVAASTACTTLRGLGMNITPSWTSGVGWLSPGPNRQPQTSCNWSTLSVSIWSSGL